MHILLLIVIFIISLYFLIKSSDKLIDSTVLIANKLGVNHFLIGLTVISIGTSLPELGAAIAASLKNSSGIVIGNIIGSNIANTAFVLGVGVLICAIKVKKSQFMIDGPLLFIITTIFIILGLDYTYDWIDGALLIAIFLFYILFLFQREDLVSEAAEEYKIENEKIKVFPNIFIIIISFIALFYSAKYLIYSGLNIAEFFNINESLIGFIAIAIGTSLPELAVTIQSAKKGNTELLLGNIIGSNISNILLVGGVASIISTLVIDKIVLFIIYPILAILTIFFMVSMRLKKEFKIFEGIIFLLIYMVFIMICVYLGIIIL